MKEDTYARQLCALSLSAFTLPAVVLLPRTGWVAALFALAAGTGLLAVLLRARSRTAASPVQLLAKSRGGRAALTALLLWNFLALGGTACQLCLAFPDGHAFPLVGLLLLIVAAQAAQDGAGTVLRMGGVLSLFSVGFYAVLLGFSLPQVHAAWLRPAPPGNAALLPCVLTPCLALFLPVRGQARIAPWLVAGVVLALGSTALCAGSLSPARAGSDAFPFYTAIGGARLFGVLERMEALVSAAVCVGGFCLLALLCVVNRAVLRALNFSRPRCVSAANFLLGGAAMGLVPLLPRLAFAAGTTIFWGLLPAATLLVENRKKFKKS